MSAFLANLARRGAGIAAVASVSEPPRLSAFQANTHARIEHHEDSRTEEAEDPRPEHSESAGNDAGGIQVRLAKGEQEGKAASSASARKEAPADWSDLALSGAQPRNAIATDVGVAATSAPEPVSVRTETRDTYLEAAKRWRDEPHRAPDATTTTIRNEGEPHAVPPDESRLARVRIAPVVDVRLERSPNTMTALGESTDSRADDSPESSRGEVQGSVHRLVISPRISSALAATARFDQLPRAVHASQPTPASQIPIHVRIGRVEVHPPMAASGAPPSAMPRASVAQSTLGFASYYRVRNYRT